MTVQKPFRFLKTITTSEADGKSISSTIVFLSYLKIAIQLCNLLMHLKLLMMIVVMRNVTYLCV